MNRAIAAVACVRAGIFTAEEAKKEAERFTLQCLKQCVVEVERIVHKITK